MVVHKIQDLIYMDDNLTQGPNQSCVINRSTPVFIFGANLEKLVYTSYNRDVIMEYQDNSKSASMMASTLVHEMVYDPNNPMDYIVPFMFSSEIYRHP